MSEELEESEFRNEKLEAVQEATNDMLEASERDDRSN
jgi:hypothetical protein